MTHASSSPAPGPTSADGSAPSQEPPLVHGRSVSKRFGDVHALDAVDLEVALGESVALWGANGAGKTTLIRCILGVMPFEGELAVAGCDPRTAGKTVRSEVGFIPQELAFPPGLTVAELVPFYGRFRRTSQEEMRESIRRVGLDPHVEKRARELSGGLRQRLALAVALLGRPRLLLFDEPTASLDIAAYRAFVRLVAELQTPDRTLIFSSHRLQEVRTLADRVLVLEEGHRTAGYDPDALVEELTDAEYDPS